MYNIDHKKQSDIYIELQKYYRKWVNKQFSLFSCKNKYKNISGKTTIYNITTNKINVYDNYVTINMDSGTYLLIKTGIEKYDRLYEETYYNILRAKRYNGEGRLRIYYLSNIIKNDESSTDQHEIYYIGNAEFTSAVEALYKPKYKYKYNDDCIIF